MKKASIITLFCIFLLASFSCNRSKKDDAHTLKLHFNDSKDPYLTELYWKLNESPMQQKLRELRPFPVGVVYYQQRGDNLDSAKKEFKIIKDLGFTALKQVQLKAPYNPPYYEDKVFHAALNEGITPWYYGKGGWVRITQELVDSLEINLKVNAENMPEIQKDPKMIEYQNNQLHARVERMDNRPPKPKGMGEPGRNNPFMPERLIPHFAKWLEQEYTTLESLKDAWNCGYTGECPFTSFYEAAMQLKGTGLDQFGNGTGNVTKDFRRYRDAMKFQSSLIVDNYMETMKLYYAWDPDEPERTGGHQIFENQAVNAWDLEGQAKAAAIGGSFYSSIHLTHHFFLVDCEFTRPLYMQSRIVADMFKGGWAATWESTGGPTQWSGYCGNTVDGPMMRKMMLSYIAAGLKGIGFWMWNSRGEGWEVGEYALTNIQGKPSDRAIEAGKISQILQVQRFELWDALDEPVVGILYSWENEAMLGRLSMGAYPLNTAVYETDWDKQFRQYHSQAKNGISRALMNNHIPFEYVTERNLAAGLAKRYPVIFLPCVIALDSSTLQYLEEYVQVGGRLVADIPLLMLDTYGRLNKQHVESTFERLFGFQTKDYYHALNSPKQINDIEIEGQFGDLKLTHAVVNKYYQNGLPAVVSSEYGNGSTTVFNFEAGRMVFLPGNQELEKLITDYTLGDVSPPFGVNTDAHSLVYRRAAPDADHYFILNEGNSEIVTIWINKGKYKKCTELIDDSPVHELSNGFSMEIPENSSKWIRCLK